MPITRRYHRRAAPARKRPAGSSLPVV